MSVYVSYIQREILDSLEEMIHERALHGNCQSKHGIEAAISFEIFKLRQALYALMEQHK
jgi:hypothetical protein